MIAHTVDTVYQGRVTLFQPVDGFRASTDSLLLAAALDLRNGDEALELGCGCGGALLPAAYRFPDVRFTGIEQDAATASLARRGVAANNMTGRVTIETGEASDWVRLHQNRFGLVFANPPYFEPGRISPPAAGKMTAFIETLPLENWVKAMLHAAKPRAPVILIHRAADLARLLVPLERHAGEITVLPIASKADEPARRVLVRARKGLRPGPLTLLAPMVSHAADGSRSAASVAVAEGRAIAW